MNDRSEESLARKIYLELLSRENLDAHLTRREPRRWCRRRFNLRRPSAMGLVAPRAS